MRLDSRIGNQFGPAMRKMQQALPFNPAMRPKYPHSGRASYRLLFDPDEPDDIAHQGEL
jgi:hypothetical protein